LYCPECAKNHENLSEEDEESDFDLQEWQWSNVIFHK
jgi:hypothetical protein